MKHGPAKPEPAKPEALTESAPSPSNAEWHAILAGKEVGPFSVAELVEKAVAGEVLPADLVKQTGGLWTKASDFVFLREQYSLKDAAQRKLENLGRFNGIWLSKKALMIGGILLVITALVILLAVFPPTSKQPTPEPKQRPIPELRPMAMTKEEEGHMRTVEPHRPRSEFGFQTEFNLVLWSDAGTIVPDVRLQQRIDSKGNICGIFHNDQTRVIQRLNLLIETREWTRSYDVSLYASSQSTVPFSIYTGSANTELQSFKVMETMLVLR